MSNLKDRHSSWQLSFPCCSKVQRWILFFNLYFNFLFSLLEAKLPNKTTFSDTHNNREKENKLQLRSILSPQQEWGVTSGRFIKVREVTAPNSVADLFTGQSELSYLTSLGHTFSPKELMSFRSCKRGNLLQKVTAEEDTEKEWITSHLCTFVPFT